MRTFYVIKPDGPDLDRHEVIGQYRERSAKDAVFKFVEDFRHAKDYFLIKFIKGHLHVLSSV